MSRKFLLGLFFCSYLGLLPSWGMYSGSEKEVEEEEVPNATQEVFGPYSPGVEGRSSFSDYLSWLALGGREGERQGMPLLEEITSGSSSLGMPLPFAHPAQVLQRSVALHPLTLRRPLSNEQQSRWAQSLFTSITQALQRAYVAIYPAPLDQETSVSAGSDLLRAARSLPGISPDIFNVQNIVRTLVISADVDSLERLEHYLEEQEISNRAFLNDVQGRDYLLSENTLLVGGRRFGEALDLSRGRLMALPSRLEPSEVSGVRSLSFANNLLLRLPPNFGHLFSSALLLWFLKILSGEK